MVYLDDTYSNYKYLVEASDNYIVLSNDNMVTGSWENPDTIDIIYVYFKPSTLVLQSSRTFSNTQRFTNVSSNFDDNFWNRVDATNMLLVGSIVVLWFCIIANCVTSLVNKGGIFGR